MTGYVPPRTDSRVAPDPLRQRDVLHAVPDLDRPPLPQTGRAEPHLGSTSDEASADGELRRRHAFYNQFNAPPRNTGRRFPWRIALLVTATLAGLISTCWLDLTRSDVLPAMRIANSNAVSSMTVDADGKVRMRKGIDRAELPNDGIPNEETLTAASTASTASTASRQTEPKSAEGRGDIAAAAATKVAEASDNEGDKQRDKDKDEDKGDGRVAANAKDSAAGKGGARSAETRIAAAASAGAAVKKPASVSRKATSVSHAAVAAKPKARPVHRVARRDPEVERLRQQAEDELKKKTSDSVKLAEASSTSRRGLTRDISRLVRARFNSCTRAGNFFEREKCKWEVCGGMWGRNGCPSYRNGVPQ